MNTINFNLYKLFSYVATSKSFAEAGRKLGMSASNVNAHISNLEKKSETKLFNRTHQGVYLTKAGKELYSFVAKGMSNLEYGEELLKQKNTLSNGKIRIGCPSHITLYYLMDYIEKAKKDYPNLTLEIISNANASELIDQLIDNKFDFLLLDNIQHNSDNLVVKKWKSEKNVFVSKNPLKIDTIKELENLKYILNFEYTNTNIKLLNILKRCNIEIKDIIKCDVTEIRVDAVKRDLGIAYVMKKAVENELKNGELYEVELPINLPNIDINLIYVKNNLAKVDQLFIKKYLKD